MQVLKLQLPDTEFGNKKELEDSILNEGNIFAIADGITRDPIGVLDFTGKSELELLENYPKPSPAKISANTFTQSFVDALKDKTDLNIDNVESAFIAGNRKIQELNAEKNPNPDYLVNDFWACVATGVVLNEHSLFWGAIGDCGVKVYDENFKLKFSTPNSVEVFEKYFFGPENPHLKDFKWANPEDRVLIRKEFRNNPKQTFKDECVGFGSLTGETVALDFLYFGNVYISDKDTVVIYSDGYLKMMENENFSKVLAKTVSANNLDEFKKFDSELSSTDHHHYGHERSIMVINL